MTGVCRVRAKLLPNCSDPRHYFVATGDKGPGKHQKCLYCDVLIGDTPEWKGGAGQ